MKPNAMLAIDLGASNGRVVWGSWTPDGLQMQEIYRFVNQPVQENGLLCWDVPQLFAEVVTGMRLCVKAGLAFDTVGLCSWGNTVGVLNEAGELLRTPIHYRETAPEKVLPSIYRKYTRRELFEQTLFIPMAMQPAVVLNYLLAEQPELMAQARTVLMISDLFNDLLCGKAASEKTMAATSQLVDMRNGAWNRDYMRGLGINPGWLPELIDNGTVLGPLQGELCKKIGLKKPPVVIAVSGHDTASASGCVPVGRLEESLYLSCGTWSCMGCRVPSALSGDALYESGATNDLGLSGQHHLRFNHTGLWILQECRRAWNENGKTMHYSQMMKLASRGGPFLAAIDTEDESFFLRGDMPQKVQAYCRKTDQWIPETPGEIVRVVLESLAFRYRYSADTLSALSGLKFTELRLLNGGSKNPLLCRFTANALGMKVLAGPSEASVIGNFMQQGLAVGTLKDDAQDAIGKNAGITVYQPQEEALWDKYYRQALARFGWKQIEAVGE